LRAGDRGDEVHVVEVGVDLLTSFGLGLEDVLEVHDAEGETTGLVLGAEAEDRLLGGVLADEFAHAEETLHEAFGLGVHHGGHRGEVARLEEVAQAIVGPWASRPPPLARVCLRKTSM
jgi:hypothetical protein